MGRCTVTGEEDVTYAAIPIDRTGRNRAELLGKGDRGVIAAGKLADLIAVDGNPLAAIARRPRVFS